MPLVKLRKELETTRDTLDVWTRENVLVAPRVELDRAYTVQRVMKTSLETWDAKGAEAVLVLGMERIQTIRRLLKESPAFISTVHYQRISELETWERIVHTLSCVLQTRKAEAGRRTRFSLRLATKIGIILAPLAAQLLFLLFDVLDDLV